MNIESNFVEDVRATYAARLQGWGYTLAPSVGDLNKDTHRVCVDYWNAEARRVPVRKRAVHRSAELTARHASLSLEIQNGISKVEQECLAGADLTPRLSRGLKKLDYNDKMLHDWGIHHLHLSDVVENDGYIKRTDDLLFVMRRPDDIYFLDVRPHGAWTDEDFIEIVHTNWPDTIEQFRLAGVTGGPMPAEQRKNLRDKNANAGVNVADGTFYMPPGGGMVAAGNNFNSIRWADMTIATAMSLEKAVRTWDAASLASKIEDTTGVRPDKLQLKLERVEDDHALVIVENAAKPYVIKVNYS